MRTIPILLLVPQLAFADSDHFRIHIIDQDTGRGVPLVELETVNHARYHTDSNGVVAFREPGLMDQDVFFHVRSHGYEFPKDGFGYRGRRLRTRPGGSATLKIKRLNIAERLYRVTGAGIYRDTVLLGEQPPVAEPVLNGQVFGSDSVVNTVYNDRIYWFWGDTNRPSYPLGNFHVPGAASRLPSDGGLDPDVGIDLTYFVDDNGFAKPTCQMPGEGPTWIDGLVTVTDHVGRERMFAKYVKIKPPLTVYERGLVEWSDEQKEFEHRATFGEDAPLIPSGHPFHYSAGGNEYVYFGREYPLVRVRATPDAIVDPTLYESWSYFKPGSTTETPDLDRDADGKLKRSWKRNTLPPTAKLEQRLMKDGQLGKGEALFQLRDIETGDRVVVHSSSVAWNAYRNRWTMIALQTFGTSLLGEVWYSEADEPVGPWTHARKIVTHDKYSFYNPKQHPMLAKENGRFIYFEATYTTTFSGNPTKTPYYDYNQVMYRLDLSDARLALAAEP